MRTIDRLQTQEFTKDLASKWASVFTGISVIGNRRTILHKDQNGDHAWYDLVASLGNYKQARLGFPELGLELQYNPGTAAGFCGNVLMHGVGDWGEGDRVCYALFMRKAVLGRFGNAEVGWMTRDVYSSGAQL